MTASRTLLTLDEKRQVQVHISRTPGIKLRQIQEWTRQKLGHTISTATAERIRRAPDDAFVGRSERKRNRPVLFPIFEAAILAFYRLNDGKAILTDELILEEARTIRAAQGLTEKELRLSNGWLHKFKTRHSIRQFTLHGEADSVDRSELAVNRIELKELIGQYSPQDVFNFDESALFYRLPPNKTLATVKRNGKKSEKDRITVAFCCNATGTEKMDLVVIGQSKQPRAFRKANTKSMRFEYFNNKTAWQNRSTFDEWIRRFDAKMHGRRVLLLLDNASSHYMTRECYNVKIKFLPPNMTAHVQPLDAGELIAFLL
jgi:hypothetical protein